MAFVPNINALRSNFAMRGDFLRNDFASRYGGGSFIPPIEQPEPIPAFSGIAGAAQASQMFRSDTGEMVKKVVKTDTKNLNNQIASKLNEKIQDEVDTPQSSYSRPNENVVSQTMAPEQLQDFVSKMQSFGSPFTQNIASRIPSARLTEDVSVKNAAAALRTTEDETLNQIQNPITFDPKVLQSLAQNTPAPTPAPQPAVTQEAKPAISQQFTNMISDVVGKKEDAPKDYKVSKMDVTYTKVEPPEDDYEEIESVDVTGRVVDKEAPKKPAEAPARQQSINYNTDDPWERFKMLYLDFYGGGDGAELYRNLKEKELGITTPTERAAQQPEAPGAVDNEDDYEDIESVDVTGKLSDQPIARPMSNVTEEPPVTRTTTPVTEYQDTSELMRDTNEILRAKDEKDQLTDMTNLIDMMKEQVQVEPQPPVIINNNRTISATPQSEPKTERVFSDDSTFNRLSMADSNFPQSFGLFF